MWTEEQKRRDQELRREMWRMDQLSQIRSAYSKGYAEGFKIGLQEAREKRLLQRKECIISIFEKKFGTDPDASKLILSINDPDLLLTVLDEIINASSIEIVVEFLNQQN